MESMFVLALILLVGTVAGYIYYTQSRPTPCGSCPSKSSSGDGLQDHSTQSDFVH